MLGLADNILRIINFAFFVITLGLIGSLLQSQAFHSSRVNYCMFVPPFALVTDTFYGILANIWSQPFAWPIILFVFDFLNFVFTFTAGTVLAVGTRTHSCSNQSYLDSNKITQGSKQRCREAQASTAFFYFSFFIFLAKLIMSSMNLMSNGAIGFSGFGSRRRRNNVVAPQLGGPNISQV